MPLLFDENTSWRVIRQLQDIFPDSHHVRYFNLLQSPDEEIWLFAKKEGYSIVSHDDDFHQRCLAYGAPPKVIWVKSGNIRKKDFEQTIRNWSTFIDHFLNEEESALLVIDSPAPRPSLPTSTT